MAQRKVIMNQWYRIDKSEGTIYAVSPRHVMIQASDNFRNAVDVVKTGRFQTSFSIYARGDKVTDSELEIR